MHQVPQVWGWGVGGALLQMYRAFAFQCLAILQESPVPGLRISRLGDAFVQRFSHQDSVNVPCGAGARAGEMLKQWGPKLQTELLPGSC